MSSEKKTAKISNRKERPLFLSEDATSEDELVTSPKESVSQVPARLTKSTFVQFSSLNEIQEELSDIVQPKLGRGAFVANVRPISNNALVATIGINASYLYWNRDEPIIKYVRLGTVDSVPIEKSGRKYVARFPSYIEFQDKVRAKTRDNFQPYENRLLETIHDRLATVANVRNTLTPIATLLGQVRDEGSVRAKDFISSRRSRDQAMRYVQFLEALDFIVQRGDVILAGPRLQNYRIQSDEPASMVTTRILGEVLERGHDYLTSYLKLTGLLPFLRVSNAYYTPSAQVHQRLTVSLDNLNLFHSYIYGQQKQRLQLSHQVAEVVNAGILQREEGSKLLTGADDLTDRWLDRQMAA